MNTRKQKNKFIFELNLSKMKRDGSKQIQFDSIQMCMNNNEEKKVILSSLNRMCCALNERTLRK